MSVRENLTLGRPEATEQEIADAIDTAQAGFVHDLPWGLEIDSIHRPVQYLDRATFHPTFLYEMLWNLALVAFLIWLDKKRVLRPGRIVFVYLFGGAIDTGTAYVSYVVPGVLVLCAGFGSASTALSVSQDMHNGIMDRFRSMDVSGAAVLSGHVVASVIRNAASTVLVFGIAFLGGVAILIGYVLAPRTRSLAHA